ncbi:MAG: glycosyltransferase family 39 protein [Acidobacteria bacterium]|nr:glycosyltransferase family 39 protein [Acidobacteriota bacterium]
MGALLNLSTGVRSHAAMALIVVFAGTLYFSFLGDMRQFLRAESYFTLGSKMMLETGDRLLMHSPEELPLNKPPLEYWLIGISLNSLGMDYGPARVPSGIFALLTLIVVYVFASRTYGGFVAVSAAAITATSVFFLAFARLAMPDMVLTFCVCAAVFSLVGAIRSDTNAQFLTVLAWAAIALGFLAKGPVAPVLVLGPFFLEALWSKDLSILRRLRVITGTAVFVAIASPYFFLVYFRDGIEPLKNWFINENLLRFSGAAYSSPRPFWQYPLDSFALGFFPWTLLIIPVWYYDLKYRDRSTDGRTLRILNMTIVFALVFFSASRFRLDYYILPVIPIAAIVAARVVSDREISTIFSNRLLAVFAGLIALPLMVIAAALLSGRLVGALPDVPGLWIGGVSVIIGLVPSAIFLRKEWRKFMPLAVAGSTFVGAFVTFYIANRQIAKLQPVAELAAQIPEDAEVYTLPSADGWAQDLMFQLPSKKHVIFLPRDGTGPAELRKVLMSTKPAAALVYKKDVEDIDLPTDDLTVIEGGTVYRGRSISLKTLQDPNFDQLEIITNQIPPH